MSLAVRSCCAAVAIVALSAVFHAAAGGRLPSPPFLVAMTAVVFVAALLTFRGALRVRTASTLVGIAQLALHPMFELTSTLISRDTPRLAHHAEHPAGHHLADDSGVWATFGEHLTVPMLCGHLAATMVTAIVLLAQDRAVLAFAEWFGGAISRRTAIPVLPGWGLASACVYAEVHQALRDLLVCVAPRRGPPPMWVAASK